MLGDFNAKANKRWCHSTSHVNKGGGGSTSHSYEHLVNMKSFLPCSDFLLYEKYVLVDDNPYVETGISHNEDDVSHLDI